MARNTQEVANSARAFSVRLPDHLHQQLKAYSIQKSTSLNELIVDVLTEWWERQPEQKLYAKLPRREPR